jgi:hypothetical protein
MWVTAALAALGGLIAWVAIDPAGLERELPLEAPTGEYSCDVCGPKVLPSTDEHPVVTASAREERS